MRRIVLLLAAAAVVGGCTVSTNEEPVAVGGLFNELLTTTTTTTSTTTPEDVTKSVNVWFLQVTDGSTRLVDVDRDVDVDADVQEVLNNLFTIRPDGTERPEEAGLSSAIPETAELISATIAPNSSRLVVDVRGLFGSIQGNDLRNALAQIVFTAIEDVSVREVTFRSEGEPQPAIVGSGEIVERPVNRNDYTEL